MKPSIAFLFSLPIGWTMALPRGPTNNPGNILDGLPDGGYMIGLGDDGTPYIAARYPAPELDGHNQTVPSGAAGAAAGPHSPVQKVPATRDNWGCVETEFVDPYTWTDAALGLAAWCDAGNIVGYKKLLTWIRGDSEAYICNWAGEQNCNGEEYYAYMSNPIDYYCSPYHSGWFLKGSDNKGYGRGVKGMRGESQQICFNP